MKRRIIQITASRDSLYALIGDGKVYIRKTTMKNYPESSGNGVLKESSWKELKEIDTEKIEDNGQPF